jgi:hypothetical protein
LLPNDLIILRNHGDDEEDKQDIKRALERLGVVQIKVEIQSNTIGKLMYSTHMTSDLDIPHMHEKRTR